MRAPGRPVLVGEAPSARSGPVPFDGPSGLRIARLAGVDDLPAAFDLVNLLPDWPGAAGKGSRFPLEQARAAAAALLPALDGRRVVVCGSRAAAALGFRERFLVWAQGPAGGPWAVLPHPSGVNHWWNQPEHLDAARRFLWRLTG